MWGQSGDGTCTLATGGPLTRPCRRADGRGDSGSGARPRSCPSDGALCWHAGATRTQMGFTGGAGRRAAPVHRARGGHARGASPQRCRSALTWCLELLDQRVSLCLFSHPP